MDSPVAPAPPKLAPLAFAKPLMWYNRPNSTQAHLEPQPMLNPSKLCATAPVFVPRNQQHNGFNTLPLPGPSSKNGFPNYQEAGFYYKRADSSRGDIIITEKAAIRNAVQIVERFRPNRTSYFDYLAVFGASDYDFVTEFKRMSTDEKIELLKDKEVEVVVMLRINDDEEKIESKKKNKSKKKYKSKDNKGGASMAAADINGGDMEKEVQGAAEIEGVNTFRTANSKITTVIDTINSLGPDFAKHTTSLWVTIDFTDITPPSNSVSGIPTGPRATAGVNPNQPIKFGSNFAFVTELVSTLQVFKELKQMRINLRVRGSPTGFPFTLQQLALVLPFYDLGFVDWTVSYQDEKFTATVPIRDNEFPMKWLDQKRNKMLRAREKKDIIRQKDLNRNASGASFMEQSRTQRMFALSDFVKKSHK
jgi:hypothetical protein